MSSWVQNYRYLSPCVFVWRALRGRCSLYGPSSFWPVSPSCCEQTWAEQTVETEECGADVNREEMCNQIVPQSLSVDTKWQRAAASAAGHRHWIMFSKKDKSFSCISPILGSSFSQTSPLSWQKNASSQDFSLLNGCVSALLWLLLLMRRHVARRWSVMQDWLKLSAHLVQYLRSRILYMQ